MANQSDTRLPALPLSNDQMVKRWGWFAVRPEMVMSKPPVPVSSREKMKSRSSNDSVNASLSVGVLRRRSS